MDNIGIQLSMAIVNSNKYCMDTAEEGLRGSYILFSLYLLRDLLKEFVDSAIVTSLYNITTAYVAITHR